MYFTNKLHGREKEKGITTKMKVKRAAKLLIIVYPVKCLPYEMQSIFHWGEAYFTGAWTLMKKEEPFNPDYLNIE
jgi:hypothetical protein